MALSSSMEGGRSHVSAGSGMLLNPSLTGAEGATQMSAAAAQFRRAARAVTPLGAPTERQLGDVRYELTGLCGSLLYMAPEVFQNKPYNEKADVYSLGILLFELVSQTAMAYHEVHNRISASEDGLEYYAYTMMLGYRPDMPDFIPP